MKRTQMVKKIKELLDNLQESEVRLSNKALSDVILTEVEKNGMVPPRIHQNKTGKVTLTSIGTFSSNEWENES